MYLQRSIELFRYFTTLQLFNQLCAVSAVMAGSVAGRRDYSEGAAGERLDHQEEQRLQRGASETQVTPVFGWLWCLHIEWR